MASLGPEAIITIGSFPITNTIINTIFVDLILLGTAFYLKDRIKKIPGMFQSFVEFIIETFYNLTESIAGKNAVKIFPWFITFFMFILIANWSGLIPGMGSIGFKEQAGAAHVAETHEEAHSASSGQEAAIADAEHEATTDPHAAPVTDEHATDTSHETATIAANTHTQTEVEEKAHEEAASHDEAHLIPIMRNATSDLNVTLALAVISLIATHVLAIRSTGFKDYISRFLSFNLILLFVGLLELVSEFTKIISLSFRLFGNIFAGEVVLATISGLLAFGLPVPFMLLEIIVGLVQALVFGMLTMVFMSILMTPHHPKEEH